MNFTNSSCQLNAANFLIRTPLFPRVPEISSLTPLGHAPPIKLKLYVYKWFTGESERMRMVGGAVHSLNNHE